MIWPFRRSSAHAAAKVPDGALRRYLTTAPPSRSTPLGEVALLAVDGVGEVNRQGGLDVLLGSELGAQFGAQPGFRQPLKDTRGVH